jgi:hypothetical protein
MQLPQIAWKRALTADRGGISRAQDYGSPGYVVGVEVG